VPQTPSNQAPKGGYVQLAEQDSEIFEEEKVEVVQKESFGININKNFEEIMYLQFLVEQQFKINRSLVKFIQSEQSKDKSESKQSQMEPTYPQIDQATIYKFNNMQKQYPSKTDKTKYVNVT